jgi:hypothetical protein
MARLTLVVGIALCAFGYSKCVFVSDPGGTGGIVPNGASGTFVTTLTLNDSTGVATNNFAFGEPIRFDLEAHNRTAQTINLVFPTTQIYDFVVLEPTQVRVLWRWSQNLTFPQQVTQLTFDPYSSKTYSVEWDGVQNDGTQLPPGTYRARGVLVFDEFPNDPTFVNEMGSPLVNFTVR